MHRGATGPGRLGVVMLLGLFAAAQTHPSIDTRIFIALSYVDTLPGFIAALTTSSTYPCEGYRITTRVTHFNDTLAVHIGGFVRPVPCFRSAAVAEGTAYLGRSLTGSHILMLGYRGTQDFYEIRFSHNKYTLRPLITSFSEIE